MVIPRRVRPTLRTTTNEQTVVVTAWVEVSRMAATATGLRRRQRQCRVQSHLFAIPLVVHLLTCGVADHLPPSLPTERTNHRLRPLVRGMELAVEDNLPGRRLVAAGRTEMPAFLKIKRGSQARFPAALHN